MVLFVAAGAVYFLMANDENDVGVPADKNSGIRGIVLLGPTCPVMQNPPQEGCADKPYATDIVAYYGKSLRVAGRTRSDADGRFTLPLPPDGYTIQAAGQNPRPACADEWVQVLADGFVEIQISCDTGIR